MTYKPYCTSYREIRDAVLEEVKYALSKTMGYSSGTDACAKAINEDAEELVARFEAAVRARW